MRKMVIFMLMSFKLFTSVSLLLLNKKKWIRRGGARGVGVGWGRDQEEQEQDHEGEGKENSNRITEESFLFSLSLCLSLYIYLHLCWSLPSNLFHLQGCVTLSPNIILGIFGGGFYPISSSTLDLASWVILYSICYSKFLTLLLFSSHKVNISTFPSSSKATTTTHTQTIFTSPLFTCNLLQLHRLSPS